MDQAERAEASVGPWGVNVNDGPPSYGENKATPGCKCRPSNVLYWELSEAITDDCPIHGDRRGSMSTSGEDHDADA